MDNDKLMTLDTKILEFGPSKAELWLFYWKKEQFLSIYKVIGWFYEFFLLKQP